MQKWEVVQLLAQEFISAAEKEEWRPTFVFCGSEKTKHCSEG